MLRFWRQGYECTSVAELVKDMEISPPSLYSAFGDKKRLFLESVDLYLDTEFTAHKALADGKNARDATVRLLKLAAKVYDGSRGATGCLLATGAIGASENAKDVQDELRRRRSKIRIALANRISQGVLKGQLPPETEALHLASFYMLTIQGLSTMARDGMKHRELLPMIDLAMLAWPSQ